MKDPPGEIHQLLQLAWQHHQAGRLRAAEEVYRRVLARQGDHWTAHTLLGNALKEMGRLDEAIESYRRAIALRPEMGELYANLGIALMDAGRAVEAVSAYEAGIRQNPAYAGTYVNYSHLLRELGRLDEAVAVARRATELAPAVPEPRINLANALSQQGRADEAMEQWRAALRLDPSRDDAHSNILLGLHNRVRDPAEIFQEHLRWAQAHAAKLMAQIAPHNNDRDPNRRLRISLLSADFRNHPVGRLLLPLVQAHDRQSLEITCYADGTSADATTAAFRAASECWHAVVGMSDAALAEMIRAHQIDILFDLAGHTSGSRPLLFARKPAPVQVSWLGYPDTTGLATIDYRITDAVADPPGESDRLHVEKLVRLDGCFLCLRPLEAAIEDVPRDDAFVFGCFNNFTKASPQVMRLWGRILLQASQARLMLKARGLDAPGTAAHVKAALAAHGVPIERVELLSAVEQSAHLPTYNRVDVALDTFPYSGTATTGDALSMGVSVITLTGRTHASRVSASMLASAGLSNWVARDEETYVRLAVEAAAQGQRAAQERLALRDQVARSPLCDEPRFARGFERALREMWRAWCAHGAAK